MSTFSTSSRQKRLKTLSFLHFWLRNVLRATTACTFSTSEPPKVVRDRQFLTLLTSKCASRHNGVRFFDITTSKSGPGLVCFVHFDLEMCFAPQRRALFRHLNFQKWSEPLVFCTFWLGNVLRATTACTFLTSQLPKVLRPWCVLYILTWKCASRHNGVQFFTSRLASWLRTRRFSKPTFRPSGATNHWKNTVFRDFPTFSRICIFFLLTLSLLIFSLLIFPFSLPLPCSAFHLSILSEVWLLNFLRLIYIIIYISSHLPNPATSHVAPPQAVEGGPAAFVHDGPRAPKACCGSHRKKRSAPLENHRSFMGYHHIITISSSKLGIFVRFRVKNRSSWEKSKWENTTGWRFIAGKMIELNGWFWPSLIPGRKYGTVTGNYHLQFTMAKVNGNSRSVRGLVHLSLSKN